MPKNVHAVLHSDDSAAYANAAAESGTSFDILVLDGRQRVASMKASLDWLTERGVMIWDNAERQRYAAGLSHLKERGFRQLDFWGMGPINSYEWLTAIFYRPGNLLDI